MFYIKNIQTIKIHATIKNIQTIKNICNYKKYMQL